MLHHNGMTAMRFADDELRMFRYLLDQTPFEITIGRSFTILKKFYSLGLIDLQDALTKRGRHVANKLLPPVPVETEQPTEVFHKTEETDEREWD